MSWALAVSILSFSIAAITFYLTNVRPPHIDCDIGPTVHIYHGDHAVGGSTGLYLPVTFANSSGRTGLVKLSAVVLYHKERPQQQFFIAWKDFANLKEGSWQPEEIAHSIAIPGKSTISKFIWFMWYAASQPKLRFKEGTYVLDFCYWVGESRKPHHRKHEFFVSPEFVSDFEMFLQDKRLTSKILWLDKFIDYNRILTEREADLLL